MRVDEKCVSEVDDKWLMRCMNDLGQYVEEEGKSIGWMRGWVRESGVQKKGRKEDR